MNWKTIEGYPDYEVSDMGLVRSFSRYLNGRLLKPGDNGCGYLQIILYSDGKGKSFLFIIL